MKPSPKHRNREVLTVPGMTMDFYQCAETPQTSDVFMQTTYDGQALYDAWWTFDAYSAYWYFGVTELPPRSLNYTDFASQTGGVASSALASISSSTEVLEVSTTSSEDSSSTHASIREVLGPSLIQPNTTSSSHSSSALAPTATLQTPLANTPPLGAIIGGAVGGFAVLAMFLGFVIFLCLHRRKMESHNRRPSTANRFYAASARSDDPKFLSEGSPRDQTYANGLSPSMGLHGDND